MRESAHEFPKTTASEDRSEERARTGGPTPAGQGTSGRRGMNVVWIVAAAMLSAAAAITMFRLLAGPSPVDRLASLGALVAGVMSADAAWGAIHPPSHRTPCL